MDSRRDLDGIPSLSRLRLRPRLSGSRLLMGNAVVLTEAPIEFGFGMLARIPVALLETPDQCIALALNALEVVIREVAPPDFDLTAELLPLPF
jgi:hypothetical protein